MSKKRIGILTSGGDCPGLNAVIRGAVKASHQLGYDCVGFLKGYEGLYDPVQYVHLTPSSTRGILNQGGTILGSTNKGRFAATVGVQDRQELDPDLVKGVKQTIEQLGIDGLICVGGDGSLAVSQQFHENGIPVVGVPKTIDNDLSATAFTFGFDSAIECATDALDRLHTTGASHERIMVLEVMGRHAGWIALHAGIAGGGDVILIPEVKWDWDNLCHKIMHRDSQGKKFTLVVVAEGAEMPGGELLGEQRAGQQMKLGGIGRAVADEIERRLHRETRLSVLGHLQRGGKPTTFDRVLATQFGAHAVRMVHEERFGEMICSTPPTMTSVPIMEAVNELRCVDPHGPAVQAARALGISFGDRPADEIGHNVFTSEDQLPATHVPEYVEHHPEEFAEGDACPLPQPVRVTAAPATAVEEAVEETPATESPSEPQVEAAATPEAEPEVEAAPQSAPTVVAEAVPQEEPSVEQEVADTPQETPSVEEEVAAAPQEEASVEVEATSDAQETPSVETEVEVAPQEESNVEPTATPEPVVAEATVVEEAAELDEDAAAEQVAETLLEMVADTDAAIHGEALEDPEPDEPVEDEPEIEMPETDAAQEPTTVEATEPVADAVEPAAEVDEPVTEAVVEAVEEKAEEETASQADEPVEPEPPVADEAPVAEETDEPVAETSADETPLEEVAALEDVEAAVAADDALEIDEPVAEAAPAQPPAKPDFAEAQAQLAEQIASAAKVSRDSAPKEVTVETEAKELTVAELVRQKLAAASATLEEPVDTPHEEDLVSDARSALEEALAD